MPYTPDELKRAIEKGLPGAVAHVEDLKGTGDHFDAVVAMKAIIDGDLHAFHLKTYSPSAAERAGVSVTQ
jgi:acid stress-induced BolA-like protein IbaG/YrbA